MIGLIHKIAVFLSKQYYQKKDWKSEFYKDCKNGTFDNLLLVITELIKTFDNYSEDIDLVQVNSEPIKETIDHLREALSWLGSSHIKMETNYRTITKRTIIINSSIGIQ